MLQSTIDKIRRNAIHGRPTVLGKYTYTVNPSGIICRALTADLGREWIDHDGRHVGPFQPLPGLEGERRWYIAYHTGCGDFAVTGTLQQAKRAAVRNAAYTQRDMSILSEDGEEVAVVRWYGLAAGEDCPPLVSFGDFGHYAQWNDEI